MNDMKKPSRNSDISVSFVRVMSHSTVELKSMYDRDCILQQYTIHKEISRYVDIY